MGFEAPKDRMICRHRRVRLAPAALIGVLGPMVALTAQQPPYVERVEVARVLIDARVVDERGQPLLALSPPDFSVKIGGRPVKVETAEWVSGTQSRSDATPQGQPSARGIETADEFPARRGRLVVFLVQRSLEPSRMVGLMQSAQLIDRLLRPLTSDDHIAVVSFDSRLRIWTDFTSDLARVRTLLAREVINGRPGSIEPGRDVSLLTHLTPARAERIHGIEQALRHLGESLEPLPGAKSLVLLGYGFGRFDFRSGQVLLMDGFEEASAALQRARVTVFALNVTRADHNSLQAGLESVAKETGGAYASTFRFPERALSWISQALAGHYVLSVERPDLEPGAYRIDVRLAKGRGRVTARSTYVSAETPK